MTGYRGLHDPSRGVWYELPAPTPMPAAIQPNADMARLTAGVIGDGDTQGPVSDLANRELGARAAGGPYRGGMAGGMLGSLFGPIGGMLGSAIGSQIDASNANEYLQTLGIMNDPVSGWSAMGSNIGFGLLGLGSGIQSQVDAAIGARQTASDNAFADALSQAASGGVSGAPTAEWSDRNDMGVW